jgi:NitT/TauT family transport system ATP-binding protein
MYPEPRKKAHHEMERRMIEFINVDKAFNGQPVFNQTSFTVQKNEVVGFLGRSGVGKSTILRMISGLTSPDSGTVKVNSSRVGYIFQEPRLVPWKTALENICFSLKAMGTGAKDARSIALDYMEKLDLKGFENHYPKQLSGGMCQRVSIGRAFARDVPAGIHRKGICD